MADNPNVLKFTGLCQIKDERLGARTGIALGSPWMKNGNLLKYIETHENVNMSKLVRHSFHFLRVVEPHLYISLHK